MKIQKLKDVERTAKMESAKTLFYGECHTNNSIVADDSIRQTEKDMGKVTCR